jgi:hypothetical protein
LQRFEREAKALASLNHPNVAQVFGIDQVGDTCFMAMELVHFGMDERGLPFVVADAAGRKRVRHFGLDHHRLHQILATELRRLSNGLRTQPVNGSHMTVLRRLAHEHLIEHTEKRAEVESECSPRTVRKLEQESTALASNDFHHRGLLALSDRL